MCAVAVLRAATYGTLLLLCLLWQCAFAVCYDSLLLYALMLLSRTYLHHLQNSKVCCSLAPLKLTSQQIRAHIMAKHDNRVFEALHIAEV